MHGGTYADAQLAALFANCGGVSCIVIQQRMTGSSGSRRGAADLCGLRLLRLAHQSQCFIEAVPHRLMQARGARPIAGWGCCKRNDAEFHAVLGDSQRQNVRARRQFFLTHGRDGVVVRLT